MFCVRASEVYNQCAHPSKKSDATQRSMNVQSDTDQMICIVHFRVSLCQQHDVLKRVRLAPNVKRQIVLLKQAHAFSKARVRGDRLEVVPQHTDAAKSRARCVVAHEQTDDVILLLLVDTNLDVHNSTQNAPAIWA